MLRTIKIILLSISILELKGQDIDIDLFRDELGFFYKDKSGNQIIKKHFLYAGRFYEGLAAVSENGYVGYINNKGTFIIPPKYEYALPFIDGLAKVWLDGEQIWINKLGKTLSKTEIDSMSQIPLGNNTFRILNYERQGNYYHESYFMNQFLNNKDSVYKLNINYGLTGFPCYNFDESSVFPYEHKIPKKYLIHKIPSVIIDTTLRISKCDNQMPSKIYTHNFFIINPSNDILFSPESQVQALDRNGKWRNIEFEFPSDVVFEPYGLKPKLCMIMKAMAYNGGFNTKMRIVVSFPEKKNSKTGKVTRKTFSLISNEINCSINASQFIRNGFTRSRADAIPFEDFDFDKPFSIP